MSEFLYKLNIFHRRRIIPIGNENYIFIVIRSSDNVAINLILLKKFSRGFDYIPQETGDTLYIQISLSFSYVSLIIFFFFEALLREFYLEKNFRIAVLDMEIE